MSQWQRTSLAVVGAVLALAACNAAAEETAEPVGQPATPAATEAAPPPATEPITPTPTPAPSVPAQTSSEAPVPSAAARPSEVPSTVDEPAVSKKANLRLRHPNGTTVTVQRVTLDGNAIVVDVEAFNGAEETIDLNEHGVFLTDDTGAAYTFVKPRSNPQLRVQVGETLKGSLAFLGPLVPEASELRLLLNEYRADASVDIEEEYDRDWDPSFEFLGLPVPQR